MLRDHWAAGNIPLRINQMRSQTHFMTEVVSYIPTHHSKSVVHSTIGRALFGPWANLPLEKGQSQSNMSETKLIVILAQSCNNTVTTSVLSCLLAKPTQLFTHLFFHLFRSLGHSPIYSIPPTLTYSLTHPTCFPAHPPRLPPPPDGFYGSPAEKKGGLLKTLVL